MTSRAYSRADRERFVEEYIACDDSIEAVRRSGWKPTGPKSGHEAKIVGRARVMMSDRQVQNLIAAAKAERRERLEREMEINERRTLAELRALMHSDVRRLFAGHGGLRNVGELDDDTARAIASVKVRRLAGQKDAEPEEIVEIKFWDKNAALDKGMKYLGLFERDNRQQASAIVPQNPEQQREMLARVRAERAQRKAKKGARA